MAFGMRLLKTKRIFKLCEWRQKQHAVFQILVTYAFYWSGTSVYSQTLSRTPGI